MTAKSTYVENAQRPPLARISILLPQRNQLLRQSLRLLRLRPRRLDALVCEQTGHQITEQRLSVCGCAAKMAVLHASSSHCVGCVVACVWMFTVLVKGNWWVNGDGEGGGLDELKGGDDRRCRRSRETRRIFLRCPMSAFRCGWPDVLALGQLSTSPRFWPASSPRP